MNSDSPRFGPTRRDTLVGDALSPLPTLTDRQATAAEDPAFKAAKGLPHDSMGRVDPEMIRAMRERLNGSGAALDTRPERRVGAACTDAPVATRVDDRCDGTSAGPWMYHVLDRDGQVRSPHRLWPGVDSRLTKDGGVPLAPALPPPPAPAGAEAEAEMAELYAMALVRDVPFAAMGDPGHRVDPDGHTPFVLSDLLREMARFDWFGGAATDGPLSRRAAARRAARRDDAGRLLPGRLFQGSAGARPRPALSPLLHLGTEGDGTGRAALAGCSFDMTVAAPASGREYLCDWFEWLDAQGGAAHVARHEPRRVRLPQTPRDLAGLVQTRPAETPISAAALTLLRAGAGFDPGLPDPSGATRLDDALAEPAALVALIADVCEEARLAVLRSPGLLGLRARPEATAARLHTAINGQSHLLGPAAAAQVRLADHIALRAPALVCWSDALTRRQRRDSAVARALVPNPAAPRPALPRAITCMMLPVAWPAGAPPHPAHALAYAAAAGAGVTLLKALLRLQRGDRALQLRDLSLPDGPARGGADGGADGDGPTTLIDDLDTLAANLADGMRFAGVGWASDAYEGLRFGERVATGFIETCLSEAHQPAVLSFPDFDHRRVAVAHLGQGRTRTAIQGLAGPDWWDAATRAYPDLVERPARARPRHCRP
ncbi:hypothetical protein EKE94_15230 [Mesobaculum littorinae]|uniref:Uncharacterized protein n=1 Tax=Mesobaculum littorinae TaxID=2486419 RepID=A0A438AEC0_9RHOB|nr:hypothetical protein [Mesobaculum littorinae]RVV97017.1 hypothetical protein EKE94_15230 [Mesobaculum littorinae]